MTLTLIPGDKEDKTLREIFESYRLGPMTAHLKLIQGGKNMIQMKYRDFKNAPFQQSFGKLLNCKTLGMKAGYKVKKVLDGLEKEEKTFKALYDLILDKYAEKDEKGSIVMADSAPKMKDEQAAEKELDDLMNVMVSLEVTKLTAEEFGKMGDASPIDMKSLSLLIEDLDSLA